MNTQTDPSTIVQNLLNQILDDAKAVARLRGFAANRLTAAGPPGFLPDYDADDVLQDTYLRVCRHLANAVQGWRPKPQHIADAPAFERWLCSIINAVVANEALAARTRRKREVLALPAAAPDVVAQVEARCKRDRLIERLRLHYQGDPAWLHRIDAWANDPAGHYPGQPYQAYALRKKVNAFLTEGVPELS
jgi:DNA-directed RNA polymerase specialized sigma24 family protein